jgi:hypothetical protein
MTRSLAAIAVIVLSLALASSAAAFCGFYVSDGNSPLYNDATRVSLLRDGKTTVLSMQNNYKGPAEDFAMVVPVPVVLKKKQVKLVDNHLFSRLDKLTSPRLVEYWERDPCHKGERGIGAASIGAAGGGVAFGALGAAGAVGGKVKVENKFEVGPYDVVILSSTESTALETWLDEHKYNIPDGAAPYFKPYIQGGQYFFVAKVNLDEVAYKDGEAMLAPLRFHYESDDFQLPVRLGLINSKGSQDLIAFVLAKGQRYRAANLPNVTIPTNLTVKEDTKKRFASFYSELFDQVLRENPRAVVTEYAWETNKCDPCPANSLSPYQLRELGGDVVPEFDRRGWVVTRLHTRYGKSSLGEDLVFEKAPPINGGNGMPQGETGTIDSQGAQRSNQNRFQARYIIRHFWDGEIECDDPRRGNWYGQGGSKASRSASNLGFVEADKRVPLFKHMDDQDKIVGLNKPAKQYDSLAGDVVKSWGQLVEEPEAPKDEQLEAPSDESSRVSPERPRKPTGENRANWVAHASLGAFIVLTLAAARRRSVR